MSAREITLDDIDALAVGLRILRTDGSSTPYLRLLNMRHSMPRGIALAAVEMQLPALARRSDHGR
jgi:DUF917 family protein